MLCTSRKRVQNANSTAFFWYRTMTGQEGTLVRLNRKCSGYSLKTEKRFLINKVRINRSIGIYLQIDTLTTIQCVFLHL